MAGEVIGPGGWRDRYTARGSVMLFKAVASDDDGDFSLMERTLPIGGRRPPAHKHTNCSEAYFVLDGRVSVTVAGQEQLLGREDFVLVPRGASHPVPHGGDTAGRPRVLHRPAL